LAQGILLTHGAYNLVLTTLAYDIMSVIKLSVLVTLRLLSPAAGIQTQRGEETDRTALDPATCIEAVIVEPRKLKSISTALLSAVTSKNSHFDLFTIAYGKLNFDYVWELAHNDTELRSLHKRGKLRFLSLPFEDLGADRIADIHYPNTDRQIMEEYLQLEEDLQHHDQYSRLLKSNEFWNGFTCDRILLLQSDTTLCSNSQFNLSRFSDNEYIGGHNGKAGEKHYLPGRRHLNGGFSFRNRLAMLRCIDAAASITEEWKKKWFKQLPEDAFFSNCEELKQPSNGLCRKFSIDAGAYELTEDFISFGVHRPWTESGCPGCAETNLRLCGGATELMKDMHQ